MTVTLVISSTRTTLYYAKENMRYDKNGECFIHYYKNIIKINLNFKMNV